MMIVYVIYCQLPLSPVCDGLHTSAALGHPFIFQTDYWVVATLRYQTLLSVRSGRRITPDALACQYSATAFLPRMDSQPP